MEDAIYKEEVQRAVDRVVEMAERAEANVSHWSLSSWYGSICAWIRKREEASLGFTLTLPDPQTGGEPLTIIEVKDPTIGGSSEVQHVDHGPQSG